MADYSEDSAGNSGRFLASVGWLLLFFCQKPPFLRSNRVCTHYQRKSEKNYGIISTTTLERNSFEDLGINPGRSSMKTKTHAEFWGNPMRDSGNNTKNATDKNLEKYFRF